MKKTILRRLLPLIVAMSLQNFVLWYSIEKLFMSTIGFDNFLISVMAAIYAATMLIVEIPSGILADRWSRKGVLMIGAVALAVSSLIGGLSGDVATYILAALAWGVFFGLYSGMYDSIVYDVLIEENGKSTGYERYAGRIEAFNGVALAVSSLLGGFVGQLLNLHWAYFLTIPFALLSILLLAFFREPTLHKAHTHASIRAQVVATFKGVGTKGVVLALTITLVLMWVASQVIFEFNQLWLIALVVPVVLYGPANALQLGSTTIGSLTAEFFAKHRWVMNGSIVLFLIASACLALVQNAVVAIIAAAFLGLVFTAYSIVFEKLLHDQLASNIRAGATSAISSMSKLLFIPVSLLFGFLAQASVFHAAWILVILSVIVSILMLTTLTRARRRPIEIVE